MAEIDFKKVVAEFLGTFVFLYVILQATSSESTIQPFLVVAGLLVALIMFTGGHFNPAVSTMVLFRDNTFMNGGTLLFFLFVAAQVLGGVSASLVHTALHV